jgi:hypothetical protein
MPPTRHLAALLLLAALWPRAVDGQSLTVTGRVSDQTGAALPGVLVELRADGSSGSLETVTDAIGRYEVRASHPGTYGVRFSLINFSQGSRRVTIDASAPTVVDVMLPLTLTAEVTVTGHRTLRNLAEVTNPSET